MKIPIHEIVVENRKRSLGSIDDLLESIRSVGLLQPIVITGDMRLVAGYHRLEACRRLGWEKIDAVILSTNDNNALSLELAEIDENLFRRELSALERAEYLNRRKEIYELIYPETTEKERRRFGGQRRHRADCSHDGNNLAPATVAGAENFNVNTATKTRLAVRTIQSDIQIAQKIAPDVREAIRTLPLADSTRDLLDLARKQPEEQRAIVEKIATGQANKVLEAARLIKRESLSELQPPPPSGTYDVILADPPWQYDFTETKNRAIENQYPTMSLNEIKSLSIPSAENSVLFLWAPAPKLTEALEVMETWGFKYRTCAIWDKEHIGMGYWFRNQHELLLVGVKGNYSVPDPSARVSSVIRSPRQKHSEKPQVVYEIIERMCPNARFLELFARDHHPGWTVWGNEVL